jgi:hypothetical protein
MYIEKSYLILAIWNHLSGEDLEILRLVQDISFQLDSQIEQSVDGIIQGFVVDSHFSKMQ